MKLQTNSPQGIRLDLNKVICRAKDYRIIKGDLIEVQKDHVAKSSTSGHNQKIFKKCFGLDSTAAHFFLLSKTGCSGNKK